MNSNIHVATSGRRVFANRLLNIASIGIPLFGAVLAIASLTIIAPTTCTLLVFLIYFVLCAWSISAGLHRYFSHHAFKTNRWFEYCLAFLGTSVCQGPIVRWVADHRRHHCYPDQAWDPHSPYFVANQKISNKWQGLFHSHLGWMLLGHVSSEARFAPEWGRGTSVRFVSDWYYSICVVGFLLPAGLGYLVGGPREAISCLL
jgi:stearoyl-CoA desaturase (Delta-9 desaturase)